MRSLNEKGFSVVEYAVLIVIVITGLFMMRGYIQRAIYGNWQQAGQSFAFGRQYDAQKSVACDYAGGMWYDHNCFANQMSRTNCVADGVGSCESAARASCTANCGQVM